jgi:hypothetical protein
MNGRSHLDGWENYPENLHLEGCYRHAYNLASYCQQLSADSTRLFEPRTCVKVVDVGVKVTETVIEDVGTLENYLEVWQTQLKEKDRD